MTRRLVDDTSLRARIDGLAALLEATERAATDPAEGLRSIVRVLGREGLLTHVVTAKETFRSADACLARERLGRISPLADLAFAMQGLGTYPIAIAGTSAQRDRWLPGAR